MPKFGQWTAAEQTEVLTGSGAAAPDAAACPGGAAPAGGAPLAGGPADADCALPRGESSAGSPAAWVCRTSPPSEGAASRGASREAWSVEGGESCLNDRGVWVHLYHTDSVTGWLNWALLKYAEVPIYHAGIEVYGYEWAFQYFDDAWDDETISGVLWCEPKQMPGYEYQESIFLGETPLGPAEVGDIVDELRAEWPSCQYHLTRHNCLSFARRFVDLLRVPEPFPPDLLGFGDAPSYLPATDSVVNFGWSWYKWGMQQQWGCTDDTTVESALP